MGITNEINKIKMLANVKKAYVKILQKNTDTLNFFNSDLFNFYYLCQKLIL